MGLNNNVKSLMRSVADNDLQKAKQYVKVIISGETAQSNAGFCRSIITKLETSAANLMELPANVKSLLKMEDVSISFNEKRYHLPQAERELYDKIYSSKTVNDRLLEMGIKHLNATLLYGESGTGKTTFGRYVAYKLSLPFVYLNFSNCVNSYLGGTQKNIETVFEYVAKTKCVFMIDEIDAIGLARGHSAEVGEMSRVVIAMMQALDLLGNDNIVIAATNRLDILDRALVRRFAIKHEVKPLDEIETLMLIGAFLDDVGIKCDTESIHEYAIRHSKQSDIINDITLSIIRMLQENTEFTLKAHP